MFSRIRTRPAYVRPVYRLSDAIRRMPARPLLAPYTRLMSSSTNTTLNKFVVYAPDLTDTGALQRRLSVRPIHLARAKTLHESGLIKVGGALLTPESTSSPTSEKKMVGSMFICEADNLETVKSMIERDVYYQNNVWDKEKIVILPFLQAAH
ncbi:hypothetical protein OBBRIDRAFT_790178 [Obba rivulosa]|uniref:YCII-related domain-containing protein n=1 Tax=Obba rivulosa TaxID=1052685 RepID=A0A8E2J509_9APHY|nr:hypothetical protein OBBRIDRAFT_790178 [Obba rivulosa]